MHTFIDAIICRYVQCRWSLFETCRVSTYMYTCAHLKAKLAATYQVSPVHMTHSYDLKLIDTV